SDPFDRSAAKVRERDVSHVVTQRTAEFLDNVFSRGVTNMRTYRTSKRGFTLVEILIVVIILGILAAIVIPQFTNASQDARKSSLSSQLQTVRSQIELYKLQHLDKLPALLTDWSQLTGRTDQNGTTSGTLSFGPYLQSA